MTDIGPRGSLQASANAINSSGQIVGSYYLTSGEGGAFIYSSGKMTTLPVPAGSTAVSALAINDNGEIAGALYPISGTAAHAASYANGVWTDLGTIAGAACNVGMGINLSGRVVGTAIFPQTQYHPPKPGKHVPFISSTDGLINLNTLIPLARASPLPTPLRLTIPARSSATPLIQTAVSTPCCSPQNDAQ